MELDSAELWELALSSDEGSEVAGDFLLERGESIEGMIVAGMSAAMEVPQFFRKWQENVLWEAVGSLSPSHPDGGVTREDPDMVGSGGVLLTQSLKLWDLLCVEPFSATVFFEPGHFYAPYVPLQISPVLTAGASNGAFDVETWASKFPLAGVFRNVVSTDFFSEERGVSGQSGEASDGQAD